MSEEKMSLADKLRAQKAEKQAAGKPLSLADKLRSQKAEKEATGKLKKRMSLADKLRTQKEAEAKEGKPLSLADKLKAQHGDDNDDDDGGNDLPEEESATLESAVSEANRKFRELIGKVKLTSLASNITTLGNETTKLPATIQAVRDRGYVYRSYLEYKVEVLEEQWKEVDDDLKQWVETESEDLKDDLAQVEKMVERLTNAGLTTAAQRQLPRTQSAIEVLEEKIATAEDYIKSQYETIQREVDNTKRQLTEINWIMDMKDEASFDFGATEEVFLVAKAEWDDGDDKPDGMLFLTNQRLVFEQKEKTGKRFGMFGGKEQQGVLWEVAISLVEEVTAENKGLLGGKDMVNLTLGSGAPYANITVEVKGGVASKFWAKQINRMATGNVEDERAIESDPELIERLRQAPTDCQVCGGKLPSIVEGQSEVECIYCGAVIRI
jgi:hypothetical protein